MENILKTFLTDLKNLRGDVKAEKVTQIAKTALRSKAEELGSRWFNEISRNISVDYGLSAKILHKYSNGCARLIKISAPSNQKSSYIKTLDGLIKHLRDELILPVQRYTPTNTGRKFDTFFEKITDSDEDDYLKEAVGCANSNYYRAAIVLGWSAAIDRIHKKIEQIGFAKFNVISAEMASQIKGRYKRFNQSQNVNSLSELRQVLDTTVLWVIEGMRLIDLNQHTRLRSCFEMRCHSAHPGEAPITEYNLMSFFSDIDHIVIGNPAFQL